MIERRCNWILLFHECQYSYFTPFLVQDVYDLDHYDSLSITLSIGGGSPCLTDDTSGPGDV